MIGVIVNTLAVIVGSLVGLLFKKGIPERVSSAVMIGIGLCTIYIGVSGSLSGENVLITIISIVLGAIVGTLLQLDKRVNDLGDFIGRKLGRTDGQTSVAQGFVTGCLLFCVGSMTIVGSMNSGLTGDNRMIFTKSCLDFVSSCMLSASLGIGVIFSAGFVLVFQGALVMLAQVLQPVLTTSAINEITCIGSLLIIALGLNIIGVTKIKTADYLPSIVFAPIVCAIAPHVANLVSGII